MIDGSTAAILWAYGWIMAARAFGATWDEATDPAIARHYFPRKDQVSESKFQEILARCAAEIREVNP